MSKGLEALKIVKNELKFYYQDEWNITRYPKDIETIEKELKEYEQYKAIEKELGVDLITLFKALREPAYVIVNDKIVETYCGHIGEECKTIDFEIDGKYYKNLYDVETFYVLTKEYGKTWALTREELEK